MPETHVTLHLILVRETYRWVRFQKLAIYLNWMFTNSNMFGPNPTIMNNLNKNVWTWAYNTDMMISVFTFTYSGKFNNRICTFSPGSGLNNFFVYGHGQVHFSCEREVIGLLSFHFSAKYQKSAKISWILQMPDSHSFNLNLKVQ